ncbi:MAG: hypothetical protein RIR62_291 [Pseudomonadota bacterium]|jgi:hypothetical protein
MIRPLFLAVTTALAFPVLTPMTAEAGPIRNACMRTDKGNRAVCTCIQQVADMTLRGADQRRAARLLNDPDKAHETWLSQRASDDAFWERYKAFGTQAEASCAG